MANFIESIERKPWDFLIRRAVRVYPAWWVALSIWIVIRLAVPDRLHNADVNPWSVLSSYALAPRYHTVFAEHVWPILVPGWTLQLEILLYLLFASTLLLKSLRTRLIVILALLVCLSMIGFVHGRVSALVDDLTDPLMLEFAAGIVIATQFNRLRALPIWLSVISLLVGAAIVAMTVSPATDGATTRVLTLGPAALLILAGSIGLENALRATPIRSLLLLGDASYSLYLTHPISISAAALMWERLHLPTGSSPLSVLFVPIAIASSIIGDIAFYRVVELPILKWAMSRLQRDGQTRTN